MARYFDVEPWGKGVVASVGASTFRVIFDVHVNVAHALISMASTVAFPTCT
jgi:hypothetical protein